MSKRSTVLSTLTVITLLAFSGCGQEQEISSKNDDPLTTEDYSLPAGSDYVGPFDQPLVPGETRDLPHECRVEYRELDSGCSTGEDTLGRATYLDTCSQLWQPGECQLSSRFILSCGEEAESMTFCLGRNNWTSVGTPGNPEVRSSFVAHHYTGLLTLMDQSRE